LKRLIRTASLLVLATAALALTGCGEKEDKLEPGSAEKFTLLLDFFPNADHAGIYAAQAEGYFEDVGLDVQIRQPADPAAPIKQVAAGQVDLAISASSRSVRSCASR
jgi:putative hydroxymethylpyrimidine transport system substrate-binding protein